MQERRIALDVMGGDNAPGALLRGAQAATSPSSVHGISPERLLLVGDREVIEGGLSELGGNPGFAVQHASQVVEMSESPAIALRSKRDSSIAVCARSIKDGRAGALVSMGNTGAAVGASTLKLGALRGAHRPGIAVTVELSGSPVTLLDMGANIAPRSQHLRQYGVMGSAFARKCLGIETPRVGLLNIGEESTKGTGLLKEAHGLLERSPVRFVGNVEACDIFLEHVDVVVTDGFTGNVVLKLLEGFAGFMLNLVLSELKAHEVDWSQEALVNLRRHIDYAEYGGALLLGVDGTVVIGHGRSDENAVCNALGQAARALDGDVNEDIVQGLAGQLADA